MTADEVRAMFEYDPSTGVLTWKSTWRKGTRAGTLNPSGYRNVVVRGRSYKEHRIAWLIVHGSWPASHLDHINGCCDDNRIGNLRLATPSQNIANSRRRRDNSSGFKGVSRSPIKGKWMAYINVGGVRIYLGSYDTAEAAHHAYTRKAAELFGAFARSQ